MGMRNSFKNRLVHFFRSKIFTLCIVLVILMVLFAIVSGGATLKPLNIRTILNSIVIVSFLAIGEGFLIVSGCIDLSAGTVGTTSGIMLAVMYTIVGAPWWVAILCALLFGAVAGLVNATLVNRFSFQPFIATLAVSNCAKGIGYIICGGKTLDVQNEVLSWIGTKRIFGKTIPVTLLIALAFLIVYGIILSKTKVGRKIYIVGGNRNASRLAGLNPQKISYAMFINGSILFSLAGIMSVLRVKSSSPLGIQSLQFSGITAAILGGISFGGGSGNMFGCFLGLCILNCFNNGMDILKVDTYVQQVFSGLLLLLALTIDILNSRRSQRNLLKIARGGRS